MKAFIIILQILTVFLLCKLETVKSQNSRKWLEIGNELYRVEPEAKFTWKQAAAECKKEHTNLINPKGDYDYAKLKDAIKHNFKNYSSFWTNTQVKYSTLFHHIGLAKDQDNKQKCNKFDNSSMFKFLPENCKTNLGFICEKPLLKGFSSFNTKNMVYFVHPNEEFTCEQAFLQCEKHQMSLVVLKDVVDNKLLKDYIFINYGSGANFWFSYNNETHLNCATPRRGLAKITNKLKLGFICQKERMKSSSMNMRHLILLVFVAVAATMAIVMYIAVKCICYKRLENYYVSESYYPEEIKVTEIK